MPKKSISWSCSKCGEKYSTEKQAKICELQHTTDLNKFKPELYFKPGINYPDMIVLHIGGRDRAVYTLSKVSDNADGA